MISERTRELIRQRLRDERGRIDKDAPARIALAYPSPYRVAMSSLGYQRIYRAIQAMPGLSCERVFLSDDADGASSTPLEAPVSYEALRPLAEFAAIAFSVAYELEISGLVRMLDAARLGALREERTERAPVVVVGGPLTFSNPLPAAPFADAIVFGEAEEVAPWVFSTISAATSKAAALTLLAAHPSVLVPALHGTVPRAIAACSDALLPAHSAICTPHTELSDMFLIETERGCSRGCTYCVMRRSTNGGMRIVPKEIVLETIPTDARRVGLVGAAVSDHPKIVEIVRALAERGCEVGLSSLRPDRLKAEFVQALAAAGHRTLTTALDGASERLRGEIERRGRENHYVVAAERARAAGMSRLKLYLMIGLPGETDADIDECARFVGELSQIVPVALGIAPFCPKRNTPLDGAPFAGVGVVNSRLRRLRHGLRGRADVRGTSARWAWVESVLAQGGDAEGRGALRAVRRGGSFAEWKDEFVALGHSPDGARPTEERHRLALV